MTKKDFLTKYPELNEDGQVSEIKIGLLSNYTTHTIANGDDKIKNLIKDFDNMSRCESRDSKINYLLRERLVKRPKSNLSEIRPLV